VRDVAHGVRDLPDDIGEAIRQRLGHLDRDVELRRDLVEQIERLGELERLTPELVIVVDGLDETRAEPGENPLPQFLPHVVPTGIRGRRSNLRADVAKQRESVNPRTVTPGPSRLELEAILR
jgi:hypothetical protein